MFKSKRLKRLFIFAFICMAIFAVGLAVMPFVWHSNNAEASQNETYAQDWKDANVTYESVEKNIIISAEKVLDVTEYITVTYERSGINVGLMRNISKLNKITRIVDGKKYVNKTYNKLEFEGCRIKGKDDEDFRNETAWLEVEGDYFYIMIGADYDFKDAGTYVYEINYQYDMGEDFIKDFDDFTFDILDYDFGSKVEKFSANITFPNDILKEGQSADELFSSKAVTFRTNNMQGIGDDALSAIYNPETFTLSCGYDRPLAPGRGFTVQVVLDQGYFNTHYEVSFLYIIIAISLGVAVLVFLICFVISRKSQHVIVTPEFYPPKGYSPIDVARIYRGEVRPKDIASLIIYWASVGLVELEPKANKKYYLIKKLKNYNDVDLAGGAEPLSDKHEKAYFDALFAKSDVYDTEFASSGNNRKISKAVESLYDRGEDGKKKQTVLKALVHFFSTLPFLLFIIWNLTFDSSQIYLFFIFLFPFIGVMVFVYMRLPWFMLWFKFVWCGGFAGVPLGLMIGSMLITTYDVWNLLYIIVAIFLLGNYATRAIKVRPQADVAVLGRVLGFRNFLVKSELSKLERMVYDDPEYYYHILPFCYALGITRVMEKRFKSLSIDPPVYCSGVSHAYLCTCISHTIGYHGSSSVSSGGFGGGGGGGGGSSGGGGGGGGCHGR